MPSTLNFINIVPPFPLEPVHNLTGNALHTVQKSYIRMISSNTVYTVNSNRYCSLVTFREAFFVNKVHRKPENCGAKSCFAWFLCIAKRVTVNGVNSNQQSCYSIKYATNFYNYWLSIESAIWFLQYSHRAFSIRSGTRLKKVLKGLLVPVHW